MRPATNDATCPAKRCGSSQCGLWPAPAYTTSREPSIALVSASCSCASGERVAVTPYEQRRYANLRQLGREVHRDDTAAARPSTRAPAPSSLPDDRLEELRRHRLRQRALLKVRARSRVDRIPQRRHLRPELLDLRVGRTRQECTFEHECLRPVRILDRQSAAPPSIPSSARR